MIRPAKIEEIPFLQTIYASARAFMRRSGNMNQWTNGYPSDEQLKSDIAQGHLFVIERGGAPCGVFAFITGVDPTYLIIENGRWLNDAPYGTIHRIASLGTEKGILAEAVRFARQFVSNVRMDTHADNHPMQRAAARLGFTYCGIIHLADGAPRLAYQLCPPTVSVRAAVPGDHAQADRIMGQVQDMHIAWRPDIYRSVTTALPPEEFAEAVRNETFFVAEAEGQVRGILSVQYRQVNAPHQVPRRVLFIDCIAVDAPFRRCGIGRALLSHALRLKAEKGLDGLELQVNALNEPAARFYAHCGFTPKSVNMELRETDKKIM